MIYGKQYEELFMTDKELEQLHEETDSLLQTDFQGFVVESMAGAKHYDLRNEQLREIVVTIQKSGHGDKEAFAALGETLYQWAEEEAKGHANIAHE